MANLAKLVVSLEAETAKYQRKLDQANRKIKKFERTQTKALKKIDQGFRRLATIIGVGVFTKLAFEAVRSADDMLKLTQRIGGTVEGLSELEFVADRSGVAFNTLTMGLQRMTRRIAEAAQGSGEAKDALRELGLRADRLNDLPLEAKFEAVADALSQVQSEGDRTRLAMRLFDSEGVALLQTMENGAAGIRELRMEAHSLGVTLSQDQAEAARDARDALTNLDARVSSLARNMTLNLVPAINAVITGWDRLLFNADPFPFEQQILNTQDQLEALRAQLSFFENRAGLTASTPVVSKLLEDIEAAEARLESFKQKQREALELVTVLPGKEPVQAGQSDARGYLQGLEDVFSTELQSLDIEPLTAKDLLPDLEADDVFKTSEILDPVFKQLEDAEGAVDELDGAARELGLTFQSAFEDAIVEGEKLSDVLKGLLKDILRIVIRKTVTEPLGNLIGGLFGSVPGRASGGPVSAGRPFLVGEQGPELFVPSASGRIIANGSGMGGVTINNNLSFQGESTEIRQALPGILEQNRQVTIADLRRLKSKGRF